jgi:hypothetical protein
MRIATLDKHENICGDSRAHMGCALCTDRIALPVSKGVGAFRLGVAIRFAVTALSFQAGGRFPG